MKITKYLQQQTPIIHFQHDQTGATLRATEVKPKLDRWIIERGKEMGKYEPSWLKPMPQGSKIRALDYSLKILPTDSSQTYRWRTTDEYIGKDKEGRDIRKTQSNAPLYLGDQGSNTPINTKGLIFNEATLRLTFMCANASLKDFIEDELTAFFFRYNFGTRQNKGYGSFVLVDNDQSKEPIIPQEFKSHPFLKFEIDKNYWQPNKNSKPSKHTIKGEWSRTKWELDLQKNNHPEFTHKQFYFYLFEVIRWYYQTLKSGITAKNSTDSYLNKYANDKHKIQWGKFWIQKNIIGNNIVIPSDYQVKLLRILLGFADRYEYPQFDGKPQVFVRHLEEPKKRISRVKSPITFKPVVQGEKVTVYLILDDELIEAINTRVLKEKFVLGSKEETPEKDESNVLSAPDQPIDFADLMKQYHQHLGNRFNASDFTGKYIIPVTIKNPEA